MAHTVSNTFAYVDLFSGVGGFAAAFNSFGGHFEAGAEIDEAAAAAYLATLGHNPFGSIQDLADRAEELSDFEVLAGGFPCQPFSKSGDQRGTQEERGTLFDFIEKIVAIKKPLVVILENVRNLAGPKHIDEWHRIIDVLRSHGYRVSRTPAEFSPHLLPKELGGTPQHRIRLFITATLNPDNDGINTEEPLPAVSAKDFDPIKWDLYRDLPVSASTDEDYAITPEEKKCLSAWNEWIEYWRENDLGKFPSFPLWTQYWQTSRPSDYEQMPKWKQKFVDQNIGLFNQHKSFALGWLQRTQITTAFTKSKAKFEWQAGDANSVWDGLIQFRPSGVRVKSASYTPTLVALNQTPILGKLERRITVDEAALLQGFPPGWHQKVRQNRTASYKQLGNAVHTGVIAYVLRKHCERDADVLSQTARGKKLLQAISDSPIKPKISFRSQNKK